MAHESGGPACCGVNKPGATVGYTISLAALYVVTARMGLRFHAVEGFASVVWPPTGISLAALLLFGHRLWPGVFAGAVVANLVGHASLPVALGIGAGNTAEAVVGAFLLRRVRGFSITLENVRSVM